MAAWAYGKGRERAGKNGAGVGRSGAAVLNGVVFGAMDHNGHIAVMMDEVLAALAPKAGEVYVDCTAGLGGHAAAVGQRLGPTGTVVLNDADAGNLERAKATVRGVASGRIETMQGNFAEVPRKLKELGVRADIVFADLGFASVQVEDAARGFSFMRDGPLDMRLDQSRGATAADLVNSLGEAELKRILTEFGEERAAGRVAKKLVQERARGPINTTARLAEIVRSVTGRVPGGIDPATRTFQALRIAVNDEIGSLGALLGALEADGRRVLRGAVGEFLSVGSRVAFVTFHSLEDRPVKVLMRALTELGARDVTDGQVSAGAAEVANNPRARSAKLRCICVGK